MNDTEATVALNVSSLPFCLLTPQGCSAFALATDSDDARSRSRHCPCKRRHGY